VHTGFCGETGGKEVTLEDLGVGGKIILKYVCKKYDGGHGLD